MTQDQESIINGYERISDDLWCRHDLLGLRIVQNPFSENESILIIPDEIRPLQIALARTVKNHEVGRVH